MKELFYQNVQQDNLALVHVFVETIFSLELLFSFIRSKLNKLKNGPVKIHKIWKIYTIDSHYYMTLTEYFYTDNGTS